MGAADYQNTLYTTHGSPDATRAAAMGGVLGALASSAGVIGFSATGALSNTAFQLSVFPYAARVEPLVVSAAEEAATAAGEDAAEAAADVAAAAAEAGEAASSTGIGVIVGAILIATAVAIQVGLDTILPTLVPDQVAAMIAQAQTTVPNPYDMKTGAPDGLFGLFAGALLPQPIRTSCDNAFNDYPNPRCLNETPIPPATGADPQWVVTPRYGAPSAPQATLAISDATTGLSSSMRLHGNWIVSTATVEGTTATVQTLRLHYSDWSGAGHTAWLFAGRAPAQFLTVADAALGANFDPNTCFAKGTCALTQSIEVTGADGTPESVSVQPGGRGAAAAANPRMH